jgi:Uma2 family endonuclease
MLRPMSAVAKTSMTVDEYLAWSQGQDGRWELIDGEPVKMEAERVEHLEIKLAAATALIDAIRRAKAPCQTLPDGATVRISKSTAYEPDVMVRCGPRLPRGTLEIPDAVIVVEVLSPGSAGRDYGEKVDGYFSVPSHSTLSDSGPGPTQGRALPSRAGRRDRAPSCFVGCNSP